MATPVLTRHASSRSLSGKVVIAGLLLPVGISVAVVALFGPFSSGTFVFRMWLSVTAMVVTGLGALLSARNLVEPLGGPIYARLGPAFVCYFTFAFGVFGLGWLSTEPQEGSKRVIDAAEVPPAIAIMAIALAAWSLGHRIGAPSGVIRAGRRAIQRVFPPGRWTLRFSSLPICLYVLGLMARGFRLTTGRFAYLQDPTIALSNPSSQNQAVAIIEDLCRYGLLLAALDAFVISRSLRSRLVLIVLAIVELSVGLFAGSKETVILTVASIGLVFVFGRGSVGRWAKIGAVFVVLVVFPLNQEYRAEVRSGTGSVSASAALVQLQTVLSGSATSLTPKALLVDAPSRLARRLRQVDNVALVRQKTPQDIPYTPWEELVYGPVVGSIPRAVWSEKPILSTGRIFSQEYYDHPDSLYSASAITVPGDLLRHGGLAPLLLGMAVLGVLMRLVDAIADPKRDLRLLVIFIPVFAFMIKSESDTTVLLIGLFQTLVISSIVGRMAFVNRRS